MEKHVEVSLLGPLIACLVFFLFFVFFTARLAGSQFPDQGLNPVLRSESAKSSLLDHQGTLAHLDFLMEGFSNIFLWKRYGEIAAETGYIHPDLLGF